MKKFVLTCVLLAVVSVNAHARRTEMLQPARIEIVRMDGGKTTAADVRRAILTGSQPHGWIVEVDRPGYIQIRYTKGGRHTAVVGADYDDAGYKLRYVASDALNHEARDGSAPLIHPTYNMWVRNLTTRIMVPGELMPRVSAVPVSSGEHQATSSEGGAQ